MLFLSLPPLFFLAPSQLPPHPLLFTTPYLAVFRFLSSSNLYHIFSTIARFTQRAKINKNTEKSFQNFQIYENFSVVVLGVELCSYNKKVSLDTLGSLQQHVPATEQISFLVLCPTSSRRCCCRPCPESMPVIHKRSKSLNQIWRGPEREPNLGLFGLTALLRFR